MIILGAFLFQIVYVNYSIMYVFIHTHKDNLSKCYIQFGFKTNHSTVLCTAIYIETISHYVNGGSNV